VLEVVKWRWPELAEKYEASVTHHRANRERYQYMRLVVAKRLLIAGAEISVKEAVKMVAWGK